METNWTREEFLRLPASTIAAVVPKSVLQSPALTRRGALFDGVTDRGEAYARWCLVGWLRSVELLFAHGIEHAFILHLVPSNFRENTADYREHLANWVNSFMLSEVACQWYEQQQCRSKVLYHECLPEFQGLHQELTRLTAHHTGPVMWNMFVTDPELPTRWLLTKLQNCTVTTPAALLQAMCAGFGDVFGTIGTVATPTALIQALYGEAVPPIDLYLGFGKTIMSPLPPLLPGKMHCYWGQYCAYDMTQQQLREVLYDCLYTRATWRADKKNRASEALRHQAAWDLGPTVGLGMRLGSYWYPQPLPPPPPADGES